MFQYFAFAQESEKGDNTIEGFFWLNKFREIISGVLGEAHSFKKQHICCFATLTCILPLLVASAHVKYSSSSALYGKAHQKHHQLIIYLIACQQLVFHAYREFRKYLKLMLAQKFKVPCRKSIEIVQSISRTWINPCGR